MQTEKSLGRDAAQRRRPVHLLIAGGGTGGHLFPAIAIAREFSSRRPDGKVLFVSTGNAFEKRMLAAAGFALKPITIEGIKGRGMRNQLRAAVKIPVGIMESMRIVKRFKPDLVLGVGSYASGPVAAAAWLSRIPIALHEQNTIPGITNRILSRLADRVYVSFPSTQRLLAPGRSVFTGNPVREEIRTSIAAPTPDAAASGPKRAFTVLIVGGSQGAHGINRAVTDAARQLEEKGAFFFIHQTGAADARWVEAAYADAGCYSEVAPFFENMADLYQKADLVVCRAGATTTSEIAALGKAAVFVPFPHAADDHQERNARYLSDAGAAEMIRESDLHGSRLCRVIERYASNPALARQMGMRAARFGNPDAAVDIVRDCLALVGSRGSAAEVRR